MKNNFKAIIKYPIILLFFSFLLIYLLINIFTPDRITDDLLNKPLQQKPIFSLKALAENKYTKDYEEYLKDQFAYKSSLVSAKGMVENILLKTENNNVWLGNNGYQFTKILNINNEQLNKNINYVNKFASRHEGKVTFMVVPSSKMVLDNKMPKNAPYINENTYIDDINNSINDTSEVIDVRNTLLHSNNEYIFYKTDHHWTTLGAYYAYLEFANSKGFTPFNLDENKKIEVDNFYGTTYSKSLYYNTEPDVLTYYDLPNKMQIMEFGADKKVISTKNVTMYDEAKLETRDKYGIFLYSNNTYSRISGNGEGSILIVKDSYANCFIPFLTENYETIDVVDLRALRGSVDFLIQENNYNDVLLLYSFETFVTDAPGLVYLNI